MLSTSLLLLVLSVVLLTLGYQAQTKIPESKMPVWLTQFVSSSLYLIGYIFLCFTSLLTVVLLYRLSVPSENVMGTALYLVPSLLTIVTAIGVEVRHHGEAPLMLSVVGGMCTAYGLLGTILSFVPH